MPDDDRPTVTHGSTEWASSLLGDPTHGPASRPPEATRYERAWRAAAAAIDTDLRVMLLTTGVTLDEFNRHHPGIRDAIAKRAAGAVLAALGHEDGDAG